MAKWAWMIFEWEFSLDTLHLPSHISGHPTFIPWKRLRWRPVGVRMIYRPVNAFDSCRKWKWTTEPPKNLKPVLTLLNSLDCSLTFSLAFCTPSCNRAALLDSLLRSFADGAVQMSKLLRILLIVYHAWLTITGPIGYNGSVGKSKKYIYPMMPV